MYTSQYINKLAQYDHVYYTLLLTDSDGVMPIVRIDKDFSGFDEIVPEDLLESEAQKEIDFYTNRYLNPEQ